MPYKINKRASERASREDNMTIKNMVNKIINNALNSEQYFQLRSNGYTKSQAVKLVIDEIKQNGILKQQASEQKG